MTQREKNMVAFDKFLDVHLKIMSKSFTEFERMSGFKAQLYLGPFSRN